MFTLTYQSILNEYNQDTNEFVVVEGVYLFQRSQSPYEGDVFHGTPSELILFNYLTQLNPTLLQLVFIICDILTATTLAYASGKFFLNLVRLQIS